MSSYNIITRWVDKNQRIHVHHPYKTTITWFCKIVLCQVICILAYPYAHCVLMIWTWSTKEVVSTNNRNFSILVVFVHPCLVCILQVNHIEGLRSFKQLVSNVFRVEVNKWVIILLMVILTTSEMKKWLSMMIVMVSMIVL